MLRTQELSISDEVNVFFNDSADRLDLNHGLREMLKRLWRELLVQVLVRMDDGQISKHELLALDCDESVPAAIDNVITEDNAYDIKAPLILEAANHPITPEADRVLSRGGVTILPEISWSMPAG